MLGGEQSRAPEPKNQSLSLLFIYRTEEEAYKYTPAAGRLQIQVGVASTHPTNHCVFSFKHLRTSPYIGRRSTLALMMPNTNGSRKSMMSGSKSNDTRKGAQHVSGKAPAPAAASATPTTEASAGDNGTRGGSGRMAMQISSDEINVLIYRYLQEAGFVHSAFTFAYESMIGRSNVSKANVPPGALITFLQKGLQYVGIEETIRQDGRDRKEGMDNGQDIDFTLLSPLSIKSISRKNPPIQLSVPQAHLAAALKARIESSNAESKVSSNHHAINSNGSTSNNLNRNGPLATPQAAGQVPTQSQTRAHVMMQQHQGGATRGTTSVFANGYKVDQSKAEAEAAAMLVSCGKQATAMEVDNGQGRVPAGVTPGEAEAAAALLGAGMAQHPPAPEQQQQQIDEIERQDIMSRASPDEVLELNKHTSEVFMCAWNPVFTNLLATGSGDASARIWTMGGKTAKSGSDKCRLLQHGATSADKKNKDVTTLEWSSNGELLATGSYDGVARVWSKTGAIVHTLRGHIGPIFSLKWNKSGNFLLSGSYDKSTIVWDVSGDKEEKKQQFTHHSAPALDVDWKDDETFASCSTDNTVAICKVGSPAPLHRFLGHGDEVNAVKWDPSGTLLASCSDDSTAKVWDASSGSANPLHDFTDHKQEIYTVKWSPTGPGSKNPEKPRMLATASFDSTVRLWNVQNGQCIAVLSRHRESVYSVAFSPSGDYLASGSLAGQLYVWRVNDGKHIKNFKGNGDIFEVAWNKEETRIAACFSSNVVNVIDFKT